MLQGWYSGPNGAYYCGSPCIPKMRDGKRRPRPIYVCMSVQNADTPEALDRWAAWARRKFFEIMTQPKDDQEAAQFRGREQASRLRERAARMERDAARLRSEAARLMVPAGARPGRSARTGGRAGP